MNVNANSESQTRRRDTCSGKMEMASYARETENLYDLHDSILRGTSLRVRLIH